MLDSCCCANWVSKTRTLRVFCPICPRPEKQKDGVWIIGHPLLRKLGIESSVRELSTQIDTFWNGEYPFRVLDGDRSKITDPLEWWRNIGKFDHANLISVSLQFVCGCDFNRTLTLARCSPLRFFPSWSTPCQMNAQTLRSLGSIRRIVVTSWRETLWIWFKWVNGMGYTRR